MIKLSLQSIRQLLVWTVLAGVIYPVAVTLVSQAAFKSQANGSILVEGTNQVGSSLLAQQFTGSNYFWPRPSAATYATVASGASNLGPTSGALKTNVQTKLDDLRAAHSLKADATVPAELVFTSGSGLDPDITPEGALFQVKRIATSRKVQPERLTELVQRLVQPRQFGVFGEDRVNVLSLNLTLDREFGAGK